MNKNGKSNIILLLLIPIFLILSVIVIDTIINYTQNKRFKIVTEKIITEVMNNDDLDYEEYYDEIKKLYEFNNYEIEMLVVDASENRVLVENEHHYFGLISSITNKNGENTEINILGVKFKAKKSSKTILSIEARYNNENELEFEYME